MIQALYLDYDGVLHPETVLVSKSKGIYVTCPFTPNPTLFMWCDHLIEALDPHPQVKIVLSTYWIKHSGFEFSRNKLPQSLRERVVGATFHKRFTENYANCTRWEQIVGDVTRRNPTHWIAIDDHYDYAYPPHAGRAGIYRPHPEHLKPYLVHAHKIGGITDEDTFKSLKEKLSLFPS